MAQPGAIDDIMSRLSEIFEDTNGNGLLDSGEALNAAYKYLGAGQIVKTTYPLSIVNESLDDGVDSNLDCIHSNTRIRAVGAQPRARARALWANEMVRRIVDLSERGQFRGRER